MVKKIIKRFITSDKKTSPSELNSLVSAQEYSKSLKEVNNKQNASKKQKQQISENN